MYGALCVCDTLRTTRSAGSPVRAATASRIERCEASRSPHRSSPTSAIRSPSDSRTTAVALSGSQTSVTVRNSPRLDGVPSGWVMSRRATPARRVTA